MKSEKKILNRILITTLLLSIFFCTFVYATPIMPTISGASLPSGYGSNANELIRNFGGLLSFMGYAIAIGMTIFIGIKYILASADERASLKGMFVKVVVGSFIILFASSIVLFVVSVVVV